MLEAKKALEIVNSHKYLGKSESPRLIDARPQADGSVLIFVDNEEVPSYSLEIVVKDLKAQSANI